MTRAPLIAVACAVLLLCAGCIPQIDVSDAQRVDGPASEPQAPEPAASAEPEPEPVVEESAAAPAVTTFSGPGEGNSAPFQLRGDYRVTWSTAGDCYYGVDLEGASRESVFSADSVTSGETYLYDLAGGEYYLQVITGPAPGCGWTVSFEER